MTQEMRFQAMILPNLGWDELVGRFRHVEDLGFDLASTGDHFCDWSNPPSPWFEMWAVLAGVAQATERIRIAPCVAQIPLRNPAMLARQALTVDHISGGRLEIGLGLGLPIDPSYDMIGMDNWTNPERVARFTEYVEIVDQMLSNEITTYRGEYYQVNEATMNPRSPQEPRPPITVAALGPVMVRKAVAHADTWNTMSFAETFDEQLAETQPASRPLWRTATRSAAIRPHSGSPTTCSTPPHERAADASATTSPRTRSENRPNNCLSSASPSSA